MTNSLTLFLVYSGDGDHILLARDIFRVPLIASVILLIGNNCDLLPVRKCPESMCYQGCGCAVFADKHQKPPFCGPSVCKYLSVCWLIGKCNRFPAVHV